MNRVAPSLLLALGLAGCRTPEPLAEDRTSNDEPAVEVAPSPEVAGDGKTDGDVGAAKGSTAPEPPSKPPTGGTPTEAKTPTVEPADGQAPPPAGDEPDAEPSVENAPATPDAPAVLETYFANDPDQALDDPRYTSRKPPKRAEEIQGLLDVRPLLGQPVYASAKPTADVLATIAPTGLVAATETCMWVTFQQEIKWTKGRIRCGDVFLREPDTGEGLVEMVPVLQTVTLKGSRWSRIIATHDGRTGWVRTETMPRSFTKVLAKYAAGGSRTWDRMLYTEPGATPTKLEFRGAIALRIRETRKVDGRTWLRVEARVDQCTEGSRRKLGEGWMPQHAEDGALAVYYEISC